jgi:hypothetical protein
MNEHEGSEITVDESTLFDKEGVQSYRLRRYKCGCVEIIEFGKGVMLFEGDDVGKVGFFFSNSSIKNIIR